MLSVLKNSIRMFFRNKEYFEEMIVSPIFMLLIFSFFLSYNTKHNIAVVNGNGESRVSTAIVEMLSDVEGIKLIDVKEDEVEKKILSGNIEEAVVIDDDDKVSIVKTKGDSKFSSLLSDLIENKVMELQSGDNYSDTQVTLNESKQKKVSVTNSLGVIIFKILTGGMLLAGLLIEERKSGIRNRILLSGIGTASYLGGVGIVFMVNSFISTIVYFIAAKLFRFDFGMENSFLFLIVLLVTSVLATALYLMLSAFSNDNTTVWSISVFAILPTSILAGAFFPFQSMPKYMQIIGNCFPQRWISASVEKLQAGGNLVDTIPYMAGVLAVSAIFFIIAVQKTKKTGVSM